MEATFSSSDNCDNAWGGMHEPGEWEAPGGGQANVLRFVEIRGLGIEKGRKLGVCGV
jgi:hypothetical protein